MGEEGVLVPECDRNQLLQLNNIVRLLMDRFARFTQTYMHASINLLFLLFGDENNLLEEWIWDICHLTNT